MCCESEIIVKMTKVCSRCGVEKELGEFYKNKNNKDERGVWCKECMKAWNQSPEGKAVLKARRQAPEVKAKAKVAKYNPADFENFPWIKADGYIWKVTDNIRTKIIIKKKENTCQNAA